MLIALLLLIPFLGGGAALMIRGDRVRRGLLVAVASAHAGITATLWFFRSDVAVEAWLGVDDIALLFLTTTSALFLVSAWYVMGYLKKETRGMRPDISENQMFTNAPEAIFTACLLFFLAAMTLVPLSLHFGLLWVAVEATTLASAPLIYFHRHHRSLEAAWKYLLVCSVGIALALLGVFFLAVASVGNGEHPVPLFVGELVQHARVLHADWLKAALLLFLVGYGTKMGLAPLHTWLPDAHSEAPSVVSALLSGALLNCAFVGILRAHQVCVAAGMETYDRGLLTFFGLFSMAIAALFILGQTDYKRMLAYSSIEHMGILALGVGTGGAGIYGAMLHALNHSLSKGMLFLLAGNILAVYRTKSTSEAHGLFRVLPVSGPLWVAGFLAICGVPPFGLFLSEFTILSALLDGGYRFRAVLYLLLLAIVFAGMGRVMLRMAQGEKPSQLERVREHPSAVVPILALCGAVLVLGVYLPPALRELLERISSVLGTGGGPL